jgi:tetratricopeptide (TPR) repeat protein
MRKFLWVFYWCVHGGTALLVGAERDDPVLLAAQTALDRGQAAVALQLTQTHARAEIPGPAALIIAQAYNKLGDGRSAALALRLPHHDHLAQWPERWRASAAATMGEAWVIMGDARAASQWLVQALRIKTSGYAVDRTLLLLAESLRHSGDTAGAERYAQALWRDWPRSPYRASAGLLVVRGIGERMGERIGERIGESKAADVSEVNKAREILAGIRAIDGLSSEQYVEATQWLCRFLLSKQPAHCLAIADQAMRRVGANESLLLYRALALCALDPAAGALAIKQLSPKQQQDPAIIAARERLEHNQRDERTLLFDRARAFIALGQWQAAKELLEKPAFSHAAALQLLATIPDIDLSAYTRCEAVQDVATAGTVGIILAQQEKYVNAWPLLHHAAQQSTPLLEQSPEHYADVLYWAAVTARQVAPAQAAVWHAKLLSLSGPGIAQGLAWAHEAQSRERAAEVNKLADNLADELSREAWQKAAIALPTTHVWHAAATWRAARPLLERSAPAELALAIQLLLPATAVGDTDDHRRCRFYLAQAYERTGQLTQAQQIIESLEKGASSEQKESLKRLRDKLLSSAESRAERAPLDAGKDE